MKAYRGRKGMAPFILDLDTRWVWVQTSMIALKWFFGGDFVHRLIS
jgi:hypothetical protein